MTEQSLSIQVVEQKEVEFYGDQVIAVRMQDGRVYVPVRPICDLLGVSWASQRNRINRDAVLSDETCNISVFVMNTQGKGQHRDMLCLPLDFVSGFLFGINADRVKAAIRDKLLRYQRECHKVLSEAFQEGRLTAETSFDDLLTQLDNEAVQAYKIAQAVMKLAQNQILMEARLVGRLDEHEQRLEALESQSQDTSQSVSEDEASQISQAVKAVAITLGKQTKRNEFGAVYGEMYRKFGITSYKLLPRSKFQDAMTWLTEWYQSLHDDQVGLPF